MSGLETFQRYHYLNKRGANSSISSIRKDMIASKELLNLVRSCLKDCNINLSRVRIFDMFLWAKWREDYLNYWGIGPIYFGN